MNGLVPARPGAEAAMPYLGVAAGRSGKQLSGDLGDVAAEEAGALQFVLGGLARAIARGDRRPVNRPDIRCATVGRDR
ncbi:MAG TPA: hypothetical protein VMU01_02500 [Rhizomicrobium sp.]|nr:hypothetical protein [Rhizomicrobium sp.]